MANSTTNLDLLVFSQAAKETTANSLSDAASPATLYGRRASTTSGLTWGYYGGRVVANGTSTSISNGTLSLTANQTNYIEATPSTGAVSTNTSSFTAGRIPLYAVVTGASTVSSYTDYRAPVMQAGYASADQAAVTGTASSNLDPADADLLNDVVTLANALRDALVKAGIIKGAA